MLADRGELDCRADGALRANHPETVRQLPLSGGCGRDRAAHRGLGQSRGLELRHIDPIQRTPPVLTWHKIYAITKLFHALPSLFGAAAGFVSIGWGGTQFTCYRRAFDGGALHPKELLPLKVNFLRH